MKYTKLLSLLLACSIVASCGAPEVSEKPGESTTTNADSSSPSGTTTSTTLNPDSVYTAKVEIPSEIKTVDDIKKKASGFSNECRINFGDSISISGAGAWVLDNGDISITESGIYTISGNGDCGIVVDADDPVKLVLDNANLTNSDGAAIYVTSGKLVLEAAAGTENTLTDGSSYKYDDPEEAPNAAVFSKDDILITGTGKITVNANYNNGISSKDALAAETATIVINSENNALKANDSIYIASGTFTLSSGGDSIKTDSVGTGSIAILGGDFSVTSGKDGIQADLALVIGGGNLNITTTGNTKSDSDLSSKGIKSDGSIIIGGGIINIDSTDHSIRSFGTLGIEGGSITVDSQYGKGVFAEGILTINNGYVDVRNSYEGLESKDDIVINGGTVLVNSSDDGLNTGSSSGEAMFSSDDGSHDIVITDGTVIVNAGGDGLDSNGGISVSGGTLVVFGPTNNGNGALDYEERMGSMTVTGGTVLALGSAGMMAYPSENYIASGMLNASADMAVTIADADGNIKISVKTPKNAASAVFSDGTDCGSYKIYTGGTVSGTYNATGICTSGTISGGTEAALGGGGFGGGGFGGGGFGGGGFGGGHDDKKPFEDGVIPPPGTPDISL